LGLILLAIAVSLDGMWAGLAQGLRQRRTTAAQLLAVGAESTLGSTLAMTAGAVFAGSLGQRAAAWLAAAVFLGIAWWNLREALRYRLWAQEQVAQPLGEEHPVEWSHLLLMGASVAADASLVACALAMGGHRSSLIPVLFGSAHIVLVGLGNALGRSLGRRAVVHLLPVPAPEGNTSLPSGGDEPAPVRRRTGARLPALQIYRLGVRLAPGLIFLILGLARVARGL